MSMKMEILLIKKLNLLKIILFTNIISLTIIIFAPWQDEKTKDSFLNI